jgi:hypothetical protein
MKLAEVVTEYVTHNSPLACASAQKNAPSKHFAIRLKQP